MMMGRQGRSFASRAVFTVFLCAVAGSGVGCVASDDGADVESGEFAAVGGCKHNIGERRLLCAGDSVVSADNRLGTVIGVNPHSRQVMVHIKYTGERHKYDIDEVFVTYGCIYQLCVGDSATSPAGRPGTVIGVNPYKKTVSLKPFYNGTNDSYGIKKVHYGLGCMHGTCVSDRVATPLGKTGAVIGLSPFSDSVAVHLDYDVAHYAYSSSWLFVTTECLTYGPEVRNSADPYNRSKYSLNSREFAFTMTRTGP